MSIQGERNMATHDTEQSIKTVKASEFKAKCLKLMDEVAESGEEIIITKNGKPVAKLTPHKERRGAPFGRYRDVIQIHGDLDEPLGIEWDAEKGLMDGE